MNNEMTFGYKVVRWSLLALFKLLARLDVQGLERIPLEGPAMLTVNHTSILEAPLVLAISPRQPLSALAKKEYQGTPSALVLDRVDPVYVARGEVDRVALKEMLRRLRAGSAIGVAPEGTRSPTGNLIEGKEGTAYLALQTGAWIVPIAVWGHEEFVRDLKRFRRPTIHMRVGEPFKLEKDRSKGRGEQLEEGTMRIMHAIARLLPPERRGVYADQVLGPPQW